MKPGHVRSMTKQSSSYEMHNRTKIFSLRSSGIATPHRA
jgi:hypothetical protein